MPVYRGLGIRIINSLWNLGSNIKVTDSQSGFRAYNKKIIQQIYTSGKGMSASIEILEKSRAISAIIKEVPISCIYHENRKISYRSLQHGVFVALSVMRIRLHSFFRNGRASR